MKYLVSILRIFVLVAVVLAIGNFSDIKKVKAASIDTCPGNVCTISGTGTLNIGTNTAYDNKNIIINTSTVILDGAHTFGNVTLRNNSVLTHTAGRTTTGNPGDPAVGMNIKAQNFTVEAGSKIDVSYKGYPTKTGYGEIVSDGGAYGQNGTEGGCTYCGAGSDSVMKYINSLIRGGSGGGSGGHSYANGIGPGAGGGFVGGGGAGEGYRAGGGGAGTGGGNGLGLFGTEVPLTGQQGKSDLSPIRVALDNSYTNTYDSANAKTWGYGGGGGMGNAFPTSRSWNVVYTNTFYLPGGKGGGSVTINADVITVSGGIYANGEAAPELPGGYPDLITSPGGGGAGGSISLQSNTINTTGSLEAKGGNGGFSNRSNCYHGSPSNDNSGSGGGGGGLITLVSQNANSILGTNLSVAGGQLDSRVVWPSTNEQWGVGGDGLIYRYQSAIPADPIQSKKVEVTVTWRETATSLPKTVKLYDVLRSVVSQ